MKVSFEGMGEKVMTFFNDATTPAAKGKPVKVCANGKVSGCADADKFAGVCIDADTDTATVQVRGFVKCAYTGTAPAVGFVTLAADGAGNVKTVASGGREYLAVEVDTTAKTVGFIM